MSSEPAALLEAAQAIVSEQVGRLRGLLQDSQARLGQLEIELRQLERQLDEVMVQSRFAAEHNLPTLAGLSAREQALRSDRDGRARAFDGLRRAVRQLDLLVRQIDMSSAAISGGAEGERADPFVQALRAQVIKGREEERLRLAREVHDGPAQVLANALMGLERCRGLLGEGRLERLGELLGQIGGAAREGLDEVRRFIADLRPGKLEEQGLNVALPDYIRRYSDSVQARVAYEADPLPRLPHETEIVLYRVVQESLQNAHKHARGAPVHVHVHVRQGRLLLSVRDEGPGFDPRAVARRAGRESWGLTSMRERAELIGASFTVSSRPGHGTEVSLAMPLTPRA